MSDQPSTTEPESVCPAPESKSKPKAKRKTRAKAPNPARPISQAKLDANRRNALLSTGPTSPEGKVVSSGNALKYGHCALVVPVPGRTPASSRPDSTPGAPS